MPCYAAYKQTLTGDRHPRWIPGEVRVKQCAGCGAEMRCDPPMNITTFKARKFCTKQCADKHGLRHKGEQHSRFDPNSRRRSRGGPQQKWANQVIARDGATCQHCGAKNVELHAHHVKSFKTHPELRFDVSNGVTLCYSCHWKVHTASDENAVNSVNTLTEPAEGNTEPSFRGNLVEGVTTSGRAYRRLIGHCATCGEQVSRTLGQLRGRALMFCNRSCAAKFSSKQRLAGRWPHKQSSTAVIATTSPAPEREDIV
jgi:5-methylcytosine-specific restriction endonuclease McrA